ncbi:hypothetical protein [Nonomuraea aridisoli]|uniref:hypothetical protein n=1 Tax=Nonomuraea aridisoli TaxID=2070368 RepID=UPI001F37F6E1|nr:hypothetical protein [Nonomuraea aridisoli]
MTLSPVGERDRLLAPDLARGVMLALIAVANSALYLYGRPYGIRQHVVEHGLADRVVSALSLTFVDARAYPMFAALFGYGMAHIWRRRRDDAEGRAVLRRRSRWLLAFGAVHGLLLFPGDVLGLYGLLGLLMCRLMRARGRLLLAAAALWLMPVAVISALVYGGPAGTQRAYLWSLAVPDPVTALALRPLEWVMTPFGLTGAVTAALVGVWAGRRSLLSAAGPADAALLRRAAVVGPLAAVAGGLPAGLVAAGVVTVHAPPPSWRSTRSTW